MDRYFTSQTRKNSYNTNYFGDNMKCAFTESAKSAHCNPVLISSCDINNTSNLKSNVCIFLRIFHISKFDQKNGQTFGQTDNASDWDQNKN